MIHFNDCLTSARSGPKKGGTLTSEWPHKEASEQIPTELVNCMEAVRIQVLVLWKNEAHLGANTPGDESVQQEHSKLL